MTKEPRFSGKRTLPRAGSGSTINTLESSDMGDEEGVDNINVVVRVRPFNKREQKQEDTSAVTLPGEGQVWVEATVGKEQKVKPFTYNMVFSPEAHQDDLFEFSGIKRLVEQATDGFSCTCFCYGQTGAGKTHTLTGPPGLFDHPKYESPEHGLIFRSFQYLFNILEEAQEYDYVLRASYLEIYNEQVRDLLNLGPSGSKLQVRWSRRKRGFFVENLFLVECAELDDLVAVLEEGMRNRSVGKHDMNEVSSRSHTMLTVHIRAETKEGEEGVFISKHGKLNFVDLAGSEMTKKTNSGGKTLEEANNINKSLMVLGTCISALSDKNKREKPQHIPYRDSKLTKLLCDSLQGNGVTLMVACVSPAKNNAYETLNTLRYAARAKRIKTKPVVIMDPRDKLIMSLKREVKILTSENQYLKGRLHMLAPGSMRPEPEGQVGIDRAVMEPDVGGGAPPKNVTQEEISQLAPEAVVQLVQQLMQENEALRVENHEMYVLRDALIRDQDLVCRENERLHKKLNDVNRACTRSPIHPARPTHSGELLNQSLSSTMFGSYSRPDTMGGSLNNVNVWTNSFESSLSNGKLKDLQDVKSSSAGLPENISKELERRRIGNSVTPDGRTSSYKEKLNRREKSKSTEYLPPIGTKNGKKKGAHVRSLSDPRKTTKKDNSPYANKKPAKKNSKNNAKART